MRVRTLLPALLASALPATAADYSACFGAVDSMRCIIETAEFARERNAEIDASMARVAQNRALQNKHKAKMDAASAFRAAQVQKRFEDEQNRFASASVQRVYAERERARVAHLNALANISMARVDAERQRLVAYKSRPCEGASDARPRCAAEYQRNFTRHQNELAQASMMRVAAERQRAFQVARNVEIEASIARVASVRAAAQYAAATTHCKGDTVTPRCEAERSREFAQAVTHCKSNAATTPRCAAEQARALHAVRKDKFERSPVAIARARAWNLETASVNKTGYSTSHCDKGMTPRCAAERSRQVAPNNAAGVAVERLSAAEYAALTSHCARAPQSPRCEAESVREFARARNAEVERSLAAVARERAATVTTASVKKSVGYSISHCDKGVTPRCEAEQRRAAAAAECKAAGYSSSSCAALQANTAGATGNTSAGYSTSHCDKGNTPRCVAERAREFAHARNAEIEASIAAVAKARASTSDVAATKAEEAAPLETGALGIISPSLLEPARKSDASKAYDRRVLAPPCRSIGVPFSPLPFAKGAKLDETITAELDRVAAIAQDCPGVRVEIHGFSDNRGSAYAVRYMSEVRAQAAVDYLIAAGVAPTRVVGIGRAAAEPRFPNTSNANRARNRRIEIVIRDPGMQAAARKVMWDLAELLDPTYIPAVAGLSP